MSTTSFISKAGAVVMSAAGILGVAYGIAKYVNDFENAKAEIQHLRGQIAQLHEVLAKTELNGDDARILRLEQQVADLIKASTAAPLATAVAANGPPTAPAPQAEPNISIRDRLEIGQFSGSATDGTSVWPFKASKITFSGSSQFEAEIEWPTLNAIHRIEGRYSAKSLFFKEVAFVKKGQNVIGCEYTLDSPREGGLVGTYRNCDDNASGGTIALEWF